MDRRTLDAWIQGYVKAWETNDPEDIGRLFTADALYFTSPHEEPWRGREGIAAAWIARKDEPGAWTFSYEIVAIADDLGFVKGRTDYAATADGPAETYDNLWVIRLTPEGTCREYAEWWMQRPKPGASAGS